MSSPDLTILDSARIAVRVCLGIKAGEQVLIVTDPVCRATSEAFYRAVLELEAEPLLLLMEPRRMVGSEPPPAVAEIMRKVQAVFLPVSKSLTHTKARQEASAAGARIASLPGLTEDIMARSVGADYQAIAAVTESLAKRMENSKEARVTSPAGTDLTLDITARPLIRDTGLYTKPGDWGNLPAGEVYVAPIEGSAEGRIIIDGSLAGLGLLTEPVEVIVEKGRAVSFMGGPQAVEVESILNAAGPGARNLAELGIGTNPEAELVGNILEDEKVLGTAHVAFGANASFGGQVQVPCHLDGIMIEPTVTLDGRVILDQGRLIMD